MKRSYPSKHRILLDETDLSVKTNSSDQSQWKSLLLGLSLILIMSACHSHGNIQTPNTTATTFQITRTITFGPNIPQIAEILIPQTNASSIHTSVESIPVGLKLHLQPAINTNNGDSLIPLIFSGSAPSGSKVILRVKVGQHIHKAVLPVLHFKGRKIEAAGLSNQYQASRIRFLRDGALQLSANLSGNSLEQKSLVYWSAQNGFKIQTFHSLRPGESISSHTVDSVGQSWIAVRGMTKTGSYLLSRAPNGTIQTHQNIGAVTDNINDLTPTSDGRVWFTQYKNDRVAAFYPLNKQLKSYPVLEEAEDLIHGHDGKLYYAQFYAQPAIVQLDPNTGTQKAFPLGIPGRSEPRDLAAAIGHIWYIEARNSTVWNLNPLTGTHTRLDLPPNIYPNQLAPTKNGQLWIADSHNARLYTTWTTADKTNIIGVNTPVNQAGQSDGPRALSVAPDGTLWYEASGMLMNLSTEK